MTELVVVVPHDPRWPAAFERERARLEEVFAGTGAVIEHVGSTAVPGLAAKPIIDIMVGLGALAQAEARVDALAGLGYEYVPEYEHEIPERRYFRRPAIRPRTHHLHCVERGSDFWSRHLAFRDRLRRDGRVARAYGELKMRLAEVHRTDAPAYTAAKSPFIEGALGR